MLLFALLAMLVFTVIAGAAIAFVRFRAGEPVPEANPNLGIAIAVGVAVGVSLGVALWNITGDFIWYVIFAGAGVSIGVAVASTRAPR